MKMQFVFLLLPCLALTAISAQASNTYSGTEILKHLPAGQYYGRDFDEDCFIFVEKFNLGEVLASVTISKVGPHVQPRANDQISFNDSINTVLVSRTEAAHILDVQIKTIPEDDYTAVKRESLIIANSGTAISVTVKTARQFLGFWIEHEQMSCTLARVDIDTQ